MGKKIDAIKKQVQLTPQEFMASMLNYYVFNSDGHFFKSSYNSQPLWLEYRNDDNGPKLDVLYMMNEKSFPLLLFMKRQPDYETALHITPELLSWLQSVYISETPQKPPRQRRGKRRMARGGQQRPLMNRTNGGNPGTTA